VKRRVFVIMPFGTKEVPRDLATALEQSPRLVSFGDVYTLLFAPALRAADCEPFRADEEPGAGDIRTDMFFELVTADLVIADVSILNANVFYELGVRHGIGPRGVFMVHGGLGPRLPFDVVTDRTFAYRGELFDTAAARGPEWDAALAAEIEQLARRFRDAIAVDERTIGSPVYKELPGLHPVDWCQIQNAKARYFMGVLDDWRARVARARREGFPGDILTLAEDAPTWFHRVQLLFAAAMGLVELRRFDLAESLLTEVLSLDPTHFAASCQLGLVQNRLGKRADAEDRLRRLAAACPGDSEAQGMLGRVYKDMWRAAFERRPTVPERQRAAWQAIEFAEHALGSYDATVRRDLDQYYNAINVLALTTLVRHVAAAAGETAPAVTSVDADDLARIIRLAAGEALDRDPVWASATLGELALLVGEPAAVAKQYYVDATRNRDLTYFHLDSMAGQVRLFASLELRPDAVSEVLALLDARLASVVAPARRFTKVVMASGHMTDKPDRAEPRFPEAKSVAVANRIASALNEWRIGTGDLALCGGARGGDILFAEACLARGAHVRLLIALPDEEFLAESVRVPGTDWEERYRALRERCEVWCQPERLGDPPPQMSPFARNNRWIIDTARTDADAAHLYSVLVWDERQTGDGPGGSADFAARSEQLGARRTIVNPMKL
jgi:tetratricopeptide (TPR) repeat protein